MATGPVGTALKAALKAIVVMHGVRRARTHDLRHLADMAGLELTREARNCLLVLTQSVIRDRLQGMIDRSGALKPVTPKGDDRSID